MQDFVRKLGFDGLLSILFILCAIAAYVHTYSYAPASAHWPRWVIGTFACLAALVPISKLLERDPQ